MFNSNWKEDLYILLCCNTSLALLLFAIALNKQIVFLITLKHHAKRNGPEGKLCKISKHVTSQATKYQNFIACSLIKYMNCWVADDLTMLLAMLLKQISVPEPQNMINFCAKYYTSYITVE